MVSGARINGYARNMKDEEKARLCQLLAASTVVLAEVEKDSSEEFSDLYEALYDNLYEMIGALV